MYLYMCVCIQFTNYTYMYITGCADRAVPCGDNCTCIDIEHTHRCNCSERLGAGGDSISVDPRKYLRIFNKIF